MFSMKEAIADRKRRQQQQARLRRRRERQQAITRIAKMREICVPKGLLPGYPSHRTDWVVLREDNPYFSAFAERSDVRQVRHAEEYLEDTSRGVFEDTAYDFDGLHATSR